MSSGSKNTHTPPGAHDGTVDPAEVARFEAMAAEWWDPKGPFKPLHRLNPERLRFIRDHAARHYGREPEGGAPLRGLSLLDIGCGGGLVAEPLARLGATVTAIDPSEGNIGTASVHAERAGLTIDYRAATAEELASEGAAFDIVLALEVVEHVADVQAFLATVARLTRPGGAVVMSTLNRTLRSFALAIVGAEYVMRWLPRGTHDWNRFIPPAELSGSLSAHGLLPEPAVGLVYNPLTGRWRQDEDTAVNYMIFALKDA